MWNPTNAWSKYIQHINPAMLVSKAYDLSALASISCDYQRVYSEACKKAGVPYVQTRVIQTGDSPLYRAMGVDEPWFVKPTLRLIPLHKKDAPLFQQNLTFIAKILDKRTLPTQYLAFAEGYSSRYSNFEFPHEMQSYRINGLITTQSIQMDDVKGWAHVLRSYHAAIYIKNVRCEPYGFDRETAIQLSHMLHADQHVRLRGAVFEVLMRENPQMFPTLDALGSYIFVLQQMIFSVESAYAYQYAALELGGMMQHVQELQDRIRDQAERLQAVEHPAIAINRVDMAIQATPDMQSQGVEAKPEVRDNGTTTVRQALSKDAQTQSEVFRPIKPTAAMVNNQSVTQEIIALKEKIEALEREKTALRGSAEIANRALAASQQVNREMQRSHTETMMKLRKDNQRLRGQLRKYQVEPLIDKKVMQVFEDKKSQEKPSEVLIIEPTKHTPAVLTLPMAVWWLSQAVDRRGEPVRIQFTQEEIDLLHQSYLGCTIQDKMDNIAKSLTEKFEGFKVSSFDKEPLCFLVAAHATIKLLQEKHDDGKDVALSVYRVMVLSKKIASTFGETDSKETLRSRIQNTRGVLLCVLSLVDNLRKCEEFSESLRKDLFTVAKQLSAMLFHVYLNADNFKPETNSSVDYILKIVEYYEKQKAIFETKDLSPKAIFEYLSELDAVSNTSSSYEMQALQVLAGWFASDWIFPGQGIDINSFNSKQREAMKKILEMNHKLSPVLFQKPVSQDLHKLTSEEIGLFQFYYETNKNFLIKRSSQNISGTADLLLKNLTTDDRKFYMGLNAMFDTLPESKHADLVRIMAMITTSKFNEHSAPHISRYNSYLIQIYEKDNNSLYNEHIKSWIGRFEQCSSDDAKKAAIKDIFNHIQARTPRVRFDSYGLLMQFLMLIPRAQRKKYYLDYGILASLTSLVTVDTLDNLIERPDQYPEILRAAEDAFVKENILAMPEAELRNPALVRIVLACVIDRYRVACDFVDKEKPYPKALELCYRILWFGPDNTVDTARVFQEAFPAYNAGSSAGGKSIIKKK